MCSCWLRQSQKRPHLPTLLLLASTAICEPSVVCPWPLLLLCSLTVVARRTGTNEGVQHLVEDTSVPLTVLTGSTFLSVPLQAAFRGKHLEMWKAVQQACFFEKFLRKCYFLGKIWIFQSNPSKTKPKDFLVSLRIAFFSKGKLGIFCKENPLISLFKPS